MQDIARTDQEGSENNPQNDDIKAHFGHILARPQPSVTLTFGAAKELELQSTGGKPSLILLPFSSSLKFLDGEQTEREPGQALGNRGQHIAQIVCAKIDATEAHEQNHETS